MTTIDNVVLRIEALAKRGYIHGIKAESESEGLDWESLTYIRILSAKSGLPFHLKIGGCEALTDIISSKFLLVDCLIAPMIENSFSVAKFKGALAKANIQDVQAKILIETVGGVQNLETILSGDISWLAGVNLGRTDLLASMRMIDPKVDSFESKQFRESIRSFLEIIGGRLPVTIGGKMTLENLGSIASLPKSIQPKFVESRRFILNFEKLVSEPEVFWEILDVELNIVRLLFQVSSSKSQSLGTYLGELESRINPKPSNFDAL